MAARLAPRRRPSLPTIKSALTILAVASTGAFADGGQPSRPVATVDGQPIERQEFDRWLTIAAKMAYVAVPDPATGYRRCVAAKRRSLPAGNRRTVADARLRTECKQDYLRLRDQVMSQLISFKWDP